MKYTVCTREKDIMSLMWNVFVSFGYKDAVLNNTGEGNCGFARFAVDEGLSGKIIISDCKTEKAMAELVAVAVEAALAADVPDFSVEITCSEAVAELIGLYSLDEYCNMTEGSFEITGKSGERVIFRSSCSDKDLVCEFDFKAVAEAVCGETGDIPVPETVVYSEKNAEGIGYEIAYTMRLSGCLVTDCIGCSSIEECESYVKMCGAESIIRVFPDGKIQIKETATGEITETDYNTFVGYYDDEPDGCDCGHDHHHHDHGEGCSCGHCH